jgi:cell wall-associated NlpC family hydrolase
LGSEPPTAAGSGRKYGSCLHLFILALVSLSVLSLAFFNTHSHFSAEVASSSANGLSVSGVAAAAAGQEDQVLHPSLLPLTIVTTQAKEVSAPSQVQLSVPPTPTRVPRQSPEPETPAESIMAAAGVASPGTQPTSPPSPPIYIVYTVQDGDTVNGLAAGYGIAPSSILWNNLELESADSLVPGQQLRVPTSDGIIYDIRSGDTLGDIADRFGVDVQAIINFSGNNLKSADSIAENQTIFIPNGRMPIVAATPTPAPVPQPTEPPTPASTSTPPTDSPSGIAAQAVELARSRIGAPYVPGAAGPNAFDCSGLVYWVYSQFGLAVPRSTQEQLEWATPVEMSQLQPGDIVFFENTSSSSDRISHVGIYVGSGGVVMAVNNGDIVREVPLAEPYWSDHFAGAGRPP